MNENQFIKINTITGWAVFLVALLCYILTVEPTLSFWDCGEYIATAAKLEIGHPPGAPLFQMVGAFFASFAPSPDKIALFVNLMSVFSSAFTILFLYFIIVNLTKKVALKGEKTLSTAKAIAIMGSGVVGALTYTFSDSFWYNAVEAEVYAMAMLFMSGMFWLGLKWTDNLHSPRGNKWLLLISLVVGLSFGVHFMALLTIPAIGMLFFFQSNYKKNLKNFVLANIISIVVLLLIFKLILPYTLAFFGNAEVFFVNSLNLPFNSGTIFAGLVLVAFFYYGFRYAEMKKKSQIQTILLCLLFVFVGFSSWLMIPIRANAGTVINENSPTDARLLLAYYNLEQYPETHLFYGPMFSDKYAEQDPENPYLDEKPKYERDYKSGKYIIVNHYKNARVAPHSAHKGLLPRMWSSEHAGNYMRMTEPLAFGIKPEYANEPQAQQLVAEFSKAVREGRADFDDYDKFLSQYKDVLEVEKPSFFQNLNYLFSYQIGYMYFRYFMWNFVGRQDDIQGKKDNHGNWISGIDFIDETLLGVSQKNLPSDIKDNKGRNTYYFLPLFLGLLGLCFHYKRNQQGFWVVLVLFLFTGIALKIYLNERPFEPRERDYALVGSFFTFAIWVGIGVFALYDSLKKYANKKVVATCVSILSLISVPVLMATENWDDHSRADKYSARAIAKSYLDSVDKDKGAMLFSIGDNDTFSLWYMQEVEGYRTDVRVINTSLLATDWYIDQMKRKAYTSEPIPSQFVHSQYAYGVRDAIYYSRKTDNTWQIKDLVNWIASEEEKTKIKFNVEGEQIVFSSYPTNKVRISVNKENVLKSGIVKEKDAHLIVDYIDVELPKSGFGKNRMMMLDILANNDWKRPIYFTGGSMSAQEYIWMKDYLQLDGMVYKLVPIKTEIDKKNPYDMGRIDSEKMYNIVKSWDWGNMESPNIYHDIETRRNAIILRGNLARLCETLIKEEKFKEAHDILELSLKRLPVEFYGYYFTLEPFISGYYKVNRPEKARGLFLKVAKKYQEYFNYYVSLSDNQRYLLSDEVQYYFHRYSSLLDIIEANDDEAFFKNEAKTFENYIKNLIPKDYFEKEASFSDSEKEASILNKSNLEQKDSILSE